MRLEGRFQVKAGRDQVYAFLTDPRQVSRYMPDVQDVEVEDADHFTVKARVGISHIKGTMVMKLTIKDRNPPLGTTVTGKGSGLASMVDLVTSFTLDSLEGGETAVNWQGEVIVSGKLAAFGPQGLLDRVGRQNVERFIAGVKAGIETLPAGSAAPAAS